MRIVFYSSNSNIFSEETFKISVMPRNSVTFCEFCEAHPEHEFFCVTQKPGMFLPEEVSGSHGAAEEDLKTAGSRRGAEEVSKTAGSHGYFSALPNVKYLPLETDTDSFAECVASFKPDLAIAMTFWIEPYDWLPVSDALVAEKLREHGVRTICHSVQTALICFDKWRFHNELARLGFDVPAAVFCDHDLYFCAGSNKDVLRNIYKESVLSQIKALKLPVIIKDTTGLSSYGMTVAHTYGEVAGYLNSKRNNSNRLIEEFIKGRQFGLEIYGVPGAYTVLPPFEFSVNQYGITSPKQSVKYGPCELPDDLRELMLKLAEGLGLCGAAQVDLILDEAGGWHIIEVNPRLSGMTYTYAAACGLSVFEMMYKAVIEPANTRNEPGTTLIESASTVIATDTAVIEPAVTELSRRGEITAELKKFVMSLKLPLMSENQMKEILQLEGVKLLNQTNDLAAKQEREKGFCECIIAAQEKSVLQRAVARFEEIYPGDAIILQAKKMII